MAMHKGLIGKSDGGGSVSSNSMYLQQDKTLGDYINRKYKADAFDAIALENQVKVAKKKLTFDEWIHHRFPAGVDGYANMLNINDLKQCWHAARENK